MGLLPITKVLCAMSTDFGPEELILTSVLEMTVAICRYEHLSVDLENIPPGYSPHWRFSSSAVVVSGEYGALSELHVIVLGMSRGVAAAGSDGGMWTP